LILENTGVAGNMKINENEDRVELTITLSRHDQVVSQ
jgi:hypothetical protein